MHTSPTCNFQGSANRLRDIADWQTRQGVGRVYLKQWRQSALGCVCVAGQRQIDAFLAERPDYRIALAKQIVDGVTPDHKGRLRILPGMIEDQGGLDGFFAVHLVRGGE